MPHVGLATGCFKFKILICVQGKTPEFNRKEIHQETVNKHKKCPKKFQSHKLLRLGELRGMLIPPSPSYKWGNLKLGTVQRVEMWKETFPSKGGIISVSPPVIMKCLPGRRKRQMEWRCCPHSSIKKKNLGLIIFDLKLPAFVIYLPSLQWQL